MNRSGKKTFAGRLSEAARGIFGWWNEEPRTATATAEDDTPHQSPIAGSMSNGVMEELRQIFGHKFLQIRLDPEAFRKFRTEYKDPRPGIDAEKLLEYFVSYTFLDLEASDVFMDVAAQNCPFAFFVRDQIGCKVYRQDLYYMEEGIHGEDVGGDATSLPFEDGAISKMALHNSFEHFEDNADTQFIIEAQRVLRRSGKLCIVPLFIGPEYGIDTEAGWLDKEGKKHLWGVGARFYRLYNPAQLRERVLEHSDRFEIEIFEVINAQEMDPACYLRYFTIMSRSDE